MQRNGTSTCARPAPPAAPAGPSPCNCVLGFEQGSRYFRSQWSQFAIWILERSLKFAISPRWFLYLTLHLTCKLSFKGRPTFNMQYGLKKIWQLLTSIYKWTCVIDFHLLSVKSLTLLWVNLPRMSVSFVTVVWSFFNVLSVKKMSEGCVKNHVWSSKKWPWRTHARG